MFKSEILFVVGAGGSADFGLPIGRRLTLDIATKLDWEVDTFGQKVIKGDNQIFQAIVKYAQQNKQDPNFLYHAGRQVAAGMAYAVSIDNYINIHQDDKNIELIGKIAIASAIIDAERRSNIYLDALNPSSRFNLSAIQSTWMYKFVQMLHNGIGKRAIETIFDNVSIITFNYDRCIEHFLLNSLSDIYNVDKDRAAEIVNRLRIYHPYGQIGYLPWQNHTGNKLSFGAPINRVQDLLDISQGLKTFTEKMTDAAAIDSLTSSMNAAETIIFGGFGYHEANMKLIRPSEPTETKNVYATYMGIPPSNLHSLTQNMVRSCAVTTDSIHWWNGTFAGLLEEYQMTLSD